MYFTAFTGSADLLCFHGKKHSYMDYLDPDLDMPTMRHFLSLQALQAVRFFLSTTHLIQRDCQIPGELDRMEGCTGNFN
jgi:hypothetical protein